MANLGNETTSFGTNEAPGNLPYASAEVAKFRTGAQRFRFPDSEAGGSIAIGQSPQSPPSVFNWFLPDYVVPGPLGNAGLFSPELQIATESSVVKLTNTFYNLLFITLPPASLGASTNGYGYTGMDGFFNLSQYENGGGTQLTVPLFAQPLDAANNPKGLGYFSTGKFDATVAGTNQDSISNQLDNLLPPYVDMTTPGSLGKLYLDSYNASLTSQGYSGTGSPTATQIGLAHDAAVVAVLDQCDLLLAAGYLKAKYTGAAAPNPRSMIIDAFSVNSGIGNRTYHTTQANNGFLTNMQTRVRVIIFLVATSPQALVLK